MSRATPATRMLDQAGVAYTLHIYEYDPDAQRIGLHAAESLGVPAARMLKTLLALVDTGAVCAVIPADAEVSLKRLAAALGGKAARMMAPADAERLSGYRVGGISPFGQRRRLPTVIERAALVNERVFVNGGRRGLQMELAPTALVEVLGATVADILA